MPTGTDVSNVVRVAIVGSLQDSEIVNVFHYRFASTPTADSIAAFLAAWVADAAPEYLDCLSNAYSMAKLEGRQVVTGGAQAELANVAAGGLTHEAQPSQLCGLISWRTGYSGRRARGRTYMPALSENYVVNGLIDGILLGKYATFANEARTITFDGSSIPMVIFSDPDNAMASTPPPGARSPAWYEVTSQITPNIPATQRRRRRGVGS